MSLRPRFSAPLVAFAYTGQGAERPGMGVAPWHALPAFRARLQELARAVSPYPLLDILSAPPPRIHQVVHAQVATLAVQLALTAELEARGIVPEIVIGHSAGEIGAAATAGIIGQSAALAFAIERAELMASLTDRGAMNAVAASEPICRRALSEGVSLAAINGPDDTVIAGPEPAVADTRRRLGHEGYSSRRLRIAQASHCALVDPILDALESAAAALTSHPAERTFISTVDGQAFSAPLGPSHWRRHMREPVRWAEGVGALVTAGVEVVVEIGPRPVLTLLGDAFPQLVWLSALSGGPDVAGDIDLLAGQLERRGARVIERRPAAAATGITLRRVGEGTDEETWLRAPTRIHAGDPGFVPDDEEAVRQVFDPDVNAALSRGAAARWIATDGDGAVLGRIAAFGVRGAPTAGFGFLAAVDDPSVVSALVGAARKFATDLGAIALEGPTNFGERDRFCGLLTDGFFVPLPLEIHNPPYLPRLVEGAGLSPHFDSLTYRLDLDALDAIDADRLKAAQPEALAVKALTAADGPRLIEDLMAVYLPSFDADRRLERLDVAELSRRLARVAPSAAASEVMMAYREDRPVGFIAYLADPERGIKCYGLAVAPEARLSGVEAALALSLRDRLRSLGHKSARLAGIARYSGRVVRFVEEVLGAKLERVHTTYHCEL